MCIQRFESFGNRSLWVSQRQDTLFYYVKNVLERRREIVRASRYPIQPSRAFRESREGGFPWL